ncbi:MAG: hypothetical protein IJ574_00045 [Bacilli bacterium]|nr:hypothetical protein [Bacilli bacterium]
MMKKSLVTILLGIILLIATFILKSYSTTRLVIALISIFLIILSICILKTKKFIKILLILFTMLFVYGLDTFFTYKNIHEPILAIKHKSSDTVSTFNSIKYRVFKCDKEYIFDYNYNKQFPCSSSDLIDVEVNSFLNTISNDFDEYENKYVKVNGKVSKIAGTNIIELSTYEITDESINGHVAFGDNLTLKVVFHKNLNNYYKIYDNVSVVGMINKKVANKDKVVIEMIDSRIKENNIYKDYTLSVNENTECDNSLIKYAEVNNTKIKTYCLKDIRVTYDENNIYDLSYVLQDKKVTLEELYKKSNNKITDYNTLYEYEQFNILVCKDNNDVIIGNKKLNMDNDYCPAQEEY